MITCSRCHQEVSAAKMVLDVGWLCENCLGYRIKLPEFVPQRIKDDRIKYRRDLIQPYRNGELSKEFKDAYPNKTRKMLKDGVITKKQYDKAREVWK
jgi:hypothetical protein